MAAKKKPRGAGRRRRSTPQGEYGYASIHKDPLDLRDLYYEGSLRALPSEIDNRGRVPEVLDQGTEGACTGFGLAAMVNFLVHNHADRYWRELRRRRKERLASPRMLYEMAKRYDEWPGESYEGSSIRGAMKGWYRHGVCSESAWPYSADAPGRLTDAAQEDALARPLGNYFRVRHLNLSQVHAALQEVGVVYASAEVHEGWTRAARSGNVEFRAGDRLIGGHAFAVVGYDRKGFWIQNSWGPSWGAKGFCHLSYEDWIEHAWDCWVARLAVPSRVAAHAVGGVGGRTSVFNFTPDEAVVLNRIRGHFVNLGNDGRLSRSGRYASTEADVEEIFRRLDARLAEWGATPRLLLYAHGGLNDEGASAQRIASFLPVLEANHVYPLHFMWETGVRETITHIVEDAFRARRFQGWAEDLKERFFDLLDDGIEIAARPLGRPLWSEMKENAARASAEEAGEAAAGGACLLAGRLAEFLRGHPALQVHLVGHSAGSILHAHLVPRLLELGVPVTSLTLFAPAVTIERFAQQALAPLRRGAIPELAVFNLTDSTERDDSVGPYQKSLLYLVSEAFEKSKATPLLGMQKFIEQDAALKRLLGKPVQQSERTAIYTRGVAAARQLESASTTHGGFDNDVPTLNSMLRIVLGSNRLAERFRDSP